MRVTLVSGVNPFVPRPSGIRSHVIGLATALSGLGHDVTIVGTGNDDRPPDRPWTFVPVIPGKRTSSFRFLLALFRRAARLPIRDSILHAHRPDDLAAFSLRKDLLARVLTIHGLSGTGILERHGPVAAAAFSRLESAGIHQAQRIIVLDHRTREELVSRFPGIGAKVVTGSGGVDLQRFAPQSRRDSRTRLGVSDEPTIAYVGRLSPEKNLNLLLDAVDRIGRAQLLVAGEGPMQSDLAAWGRKRPHIRFLGTVTSEKVACVMNAADVVALPSKREALPAACLEALACGTPVVATKVGGLEEVLREGENGFFAEPNPTSLATVLERALERSPAMRAACRRSAEPFGWDAVATGVARIYEEAVG